MPSVSRPIALALLALTMASFQFASAQAVQGEHLTKTPAREKSVLVSTGDAPDMVTQTAGTTSANALEPTPQSSDHNPELASHTEDSNDTGAQFGEALAKVAQPIKRNKPAKSASSSRKQDADAADEATSGEAPSPIGAARRAAAARADSVSFEAVKFQGISV